MLIFELTWGWGYPYNRNTQKRNTSHNDKKNSHNRYVENATPKIGILENKAADFLLSVLIRYGVELEMVIDTTGNE